MANPGSKLSKGQQRRHQKMKGRREARRNAMVVERNKVAHIMDHLKRHPWDRGAIADLTRLRDATLGKFKVSIPSPTESPKQARGKLGLTLTAMQKKRAA